MQKYIDIQDRNLSLINKIIKIQNFPPKYRKGLSKFPQN